MESSPTVVVRFGKTAPAKLILAWRLTHATWDFRIISICAVFAIHLTWIRVFIPSVAKPVKIVPLIPFLGGRVGGGDVLSINGSMS